MGRIARNEGRVSWSCPRLDIQLRCLFSVPVQYRQSLELTSVPELHIDTLTTPVIELDLLADEIRPDGSDVGLREGLFEVSVAYRGLAWVGSRTMPVSSSLLFTWVPNALPHLRASSVLEREFTEDQPRRRAQPSPVLVLRSSPVEAEPTSTIFAVRDGACGDASGRRGTAAALSAIVAMI